MKAFTDIEQCKKLEEILPIESADMMYIPIMDIDSMDNVGFYEIPQCHPFSEVKNCKVKHLPCWSLAALLNYIKDKCGYFHVYISSTFDGMANKLKNVNRLSTDIYDVYENELVDACYEMILKLNEQKLL